MQRVRGKPYPPLAKPEGESPHRQENGEDTKGGVNAAAAAPAPPSGAHGTRWARTRREGEGGDGEATGTEISRFVIAASWLNV
jgi:hypothetical protein